MCLLNNRDFSTVLTLFDVTCSSPLRSCWPFVSGRSVRALKSVRACHWHLCLYTAVFGSCFLFIRNWPKYSSKCSLVVLKLTQIAVEVIFVKSEMRTCFEPEVTLFKFQIVFIGPIALVWLELKCHKFKKKSRIFADWKLESSVFQNQVFAWNT